MNAGPLPLCLCAALALAGCGRPAPEAAPLAEAVRGDLEVWTPCDATLQARRVEPVMSQFAGTATLIEIAEEGRAVRQGERLVRFDSTQVEQDLRKAEHEHTLAEAELHALRDAVIPMERQALETQVSEASYAVESENQFLQDSRDLLKQDLVSTQEIAQQELKGEGLRSKLRQLETGLNLTTGCVHQAKLTKAGAELDAAQQRLEFARDQLSHAAVLAPCDGMVVYAPLQVGGEFRTVRLGDTVYRNQPFMFLPDMRDLVAECYIPESDLARVQPGAPAELAPPAYPELRLAGAVESVSAMAQARPGFPSWQKYFRVVLKLTSSDERLRTGISLQARIRSYRREGVTLVPRAAVGWKDDRAFCTVREGGRDRDRALRIGAAGATQLEVLEGLQPGEKVVLP